MEQPGGLTEAELDELENFLMSAATPDECMDISMLDGFLTALAVGPNTLAPSDWMPVIWGGEMQWANQAQVERISTLIFRHANAILFYLRDDPDTFDPLLYENEVDGKRVQVIDEWCSGFVQGMVLDEAAWQPLMDSDEGEQMLFPILLHGTEASEDDEERTRLLAERHEEFVAALGDAVLDIHAYWLPQRKAATTMRRDEPKTGRNEVCPCGSGKKFKKCCGAPERLH
jgi:uncharacterized protein